MGTLLRQEQVIRQRSTLIARTLEGGGVGAAGYEDGLAAGAAAAKADLGGDSCLC